MDYTLGDPVWFVSLEDKDDFPSLYNINIMCAEFIGMDVNVARLGIIRDGITGCVYYQPLIGIFKTREACFAAFTKHLKRPKYYEE